MSFDVSRHVLPLDRRNIAIDARGVGTSWTQGGTTFALSGTAAAGSSITTTIVNSGTLARLVLATGTTPGTLTLSDGSTSLDLTVRHLARWPVKGWFAGL